MHDNVYGAVTTVEPLREFITSSDECRIAPGGHQPQTKPNDSGCESTCTLPESTATIAIYNY